MQKSFVLLLGYLSITGLWAQDIPNVLLDRKRQPVKSASEWYASRQPEVRAVMENEVYGKIPDPKDFSIRYQTIEKATWSDQHQATREQVQIILTNSKGISKKIDVLMYYPKSNGVVPAFVNLNWLGNQSVTTEKSVKLSEANIFCYQPQAEGIVNGRATPASVGYHTFRLPIDSITKAGFAVITACYQDLCSDINEVYRHDGAPFFGMHPDSTGAISIWAFQHSLLVRYARERRNIFNPDKILVVGHSRLGKASLWAAANDSNIHTVFSNESGCTGAALSRHFRGESIAAINTHFPHWFRLKYKSYNHRDTILPFDQHFLLSAIAPRSVYVSSAVEDQLADPEGEYLTLKETQKVYTFLGIETQLPTHFGQKLTYQKKSKLGYHIREGQHDLSPLDWKLFIHFAKVNLE